MIDLHDKSSWKLENIGRKTSLLRIRGWVSDTLQVVRGWRRAPAVVY